MKRFFTDDRQKQFRFIYLGLIVCLAIFLGSGAGAYADFKFPELTDRVVDSAQILTPQDRGALVEQLKALEENSSHQVVVATVTSLQETDIADYANKLFRHWQIGQKTKNNGILLLVAPTERKVRIEVGYGLEGTFPDALASVIIKTAIIPKFRTGDYSGGIVSGVKGIVEVLSGDKSNWEKLAQRQPEQLPDWVAIFIFLLVFFIIWRAISHQNQRRNLRTGWGQNGVRTYEWPPIVFGGGGFGGGGGGDWGGFGGGGGSSGGGGASGSW